jgi:hypothetical protein
MEKGSISWLSNRSHPDTLMRMDLHTILTQIDNEIARLQQAKALLTGSNSSINVPATRAAKTAGNKPVKRQLSPDAIARIRAAQKRRWAKAKKAAQ